VPIEPEVVKGARVRRRYRDPNTAIAAIANPQPGTRQKRQLAADRTIDDQIGNQAQSKFPENRSGAFGIGSVTTT